MCSPGSASHSRSHWRQASTLTSVARFAELIASLTERAERRGSVAELLEATLSESGYIEALEAERTIEAEGRIENLQELIGMAAEFDANRELEGDSELAPLEEFLEQIALINEQDALTDDATKVTLMTIHNAKGLEYKAVFIIGCEDGVFPHSRSIDEGNLEELASDYVALRSRLPELRVLGGCCGTDHRHIDAMSKAWLNR